MPEHCEDKNSRNRRLKKCRNYLNINKQLSIAKSLNNWYPRNRNCQQNNNKCPKTKTNIELDKRNCVVKRHQHGNTYAYMKH